jgi:hypothetical protein
MVNSYAQSFYLDPDVWGPKYWFFFHTLAMTYPKNPNATIKKKYYDFVQTIPMFIPVEKISSEFSELLNLYPIQPYLDNKESFIRWFWFIHNKINERLEKPKISLSDFYVKYYEEYKNKTLKQLDYYKWKERIVYISLIFMLSLLIYYLYDK